MLFRATSYVTSATPRQGLKGWPGPWSTTRSCATPAGWSTSADPPSWRTSSVSRMVTRQWDWFLYPIHGHSYELVNISYYKYLVIKFMFVCVNYNLIYIPVMSLHFRLYWQWYTFHLLGFTWIFCAGTELSLWPSYGRDPANPACIEVFSQQESVLVKF